MRRLLDLLRGAVPLLVSLVALVAVGVWISRQEAPTIPTSGDALALLAASLVLYTTITLLRGLRWHVILGLEHQKHKAADAFGLTTVGYMGNAVLPARGGEVLRVLLLAERADLRRRDVVGSIIPERILDAAVLALLFLALTIGGRAEERLGPWPALGAGAAVVVGAIAVYIYLRLRVAGHFASLADTIRPFTRASRLLLSRTGVAMALLTLLVWALEASVFWCVASALDLEGVGLFGSALVVVAASFFAMIPAGPGYVGTFDAAVIFALGILDVRGGEAVSALLLYRFVVFVPITVAGLVLVLTRYGGLRLLRRGASGARDDEELLAEEPPGERRLEVPAGQ
jgi:uncharacterized membrane protein YbhN (UPF0104 family)